MANFYRNDKDIGYLEINFMELINYSRNGFPVCDECLSDLIGYNDIILIPYTNEAYCNKHGGERLKRLTRHPEDEPVRKRREDFFLNYFELEENQ